jgi:2'-5' RNA ligase
VRLFVAIDIPSDVRNAIAADTIALRRTSDAVKWVDTPLLHLTLRFLGECDDARAGVVRAALERIAGAHAPHEVTFAGSGAFPDVRRPRVLWIGAVTAPQLAALAADVERGVVEAGIEPEPRPFRAHLTLGRARRELADTEARRVAAGLGALKGRYVVPVTTLHLMRSDLSATGPSYTSIAELPLGSTSLTTR